MLGPVAWASTTYAERLSRRRGTVGPHRSGGVFSSIPRESVDEPEDLLSIYIQPHPLRLTQQQQQQQPKVTVHLLSPPEPQAPNQKLLRVPVFKMHISNALPLASALLLSLTPLTQADDFDAEDVPATCVSVCRPLSDLVRACDVDDDDVGGDRNEDLLERQCVCTNDSFDVADVAGQCQGCIEEHFTEGCGDLDDDDDDDEDCDGLEGKS